MMYWKCSELDFYLEVLNHYLWCILDSTQSSSENQITKRMPAVNNSREAGANSERALRWYNSTCLGNSVKSFKVENIEMISPDQLSAYLSSIYNFEKLADEDAYKPIFWEGTREEPKIELPDVLKALPFNALNKGKEKDKFAHSPGSTHLSMLNEYCKKNIKKSVEWIDSICNDNQFAVEAVIDGIKYGRGEAKSKKGAKQLAAKNTLEILMPEPMAIISNFSIGVKELAVRLCLNIVSLFYCCSRDLGIGSKLVHIISL